MNSFGETRGILHETKDLYFVFQLSVHMSCCKYPPAEQLPEIWMNSLSPMLELVQTAIQGKFFSCVFYDIIKVVFIVK